MVNLLTNLLGGRQVSVLGKIRYAVGTAPNEILYAVFYTYFMIYLTDVAGMKPVTAGIIAGVAAFCDGFVDPAIGVYSDREARKDGTRRPVMARALVPLSVVSILLFLPLGLTGAVQIIYYFIVAMLFVSMYSLWCTNFLAVGGEITSDYAERNTMRLIVSLATPIYSFLGSGGPQLVRVALPDIGVKSQWLLVGIVLSVISILLALVMITMLPSKKKVQELKSRGEFHLQFEGGEGEENEKYEFLRNIKEILKLKPLILQAVMTLCFSLGNGFRYSLVVYVLTYTIGLSAAEQSAYWAATNVGWYVTMFGCVAAANAIGSKRAVFAGGFAIAAISSFYYYFAGLDSLFAICVLGITFEFIEGPFWTLWAAISFEIADLDEFVFGKRRTALIASISSFMVKIGPTVALISTGALLSFLGYVEGGAEQAPETAAALGDWITLLPGIFFAIGAVTFANYSINRKNNTALNKALEKKRAGEPYSTEGFEELLPKWYKDESRQN